jgi:hypothetical protein
MQIRKLVCVSSSPSPYVQFGVLNPHFLHCSMSEADSQVVSGPTREDTTLDIYLLRPESLFISCCVVPGISDHNGVLLEVD